ncbi:MAG: hypothetical protein LUC92_09425 [Clostridiales bacterium]|nr:hypothetical protein [Clostridiales bacterium]
MDKNKKAEKLTSMLIKIIIVLVIVDILLMTADMIIILCNIDTSEVFTPKFYRYISYIFCILFLPIMAMSAVIAIITYTADFIMKREINGFYIYIQLCLALIIWCIYLIGVLALMLFYDDFGNIINGIIRYLTNKVSPRLLGGGYLLSIQ